MPGNLGGHAFLPGGLSADYELDGARVRLLLCDLPDEAEARADELIATYKMGEAGVDAMYRLFLLDGGLDAPSIGILCGTWGLAFSLAGSIFGGWIGQTRERMKSLFWVGILRAGPLVLIAVLPFLKQPLSLGVVYPVTLAEHFFGGMITPVMFAFMMDLCDRRVGATHYTALAAVEVVGKMSMSTLSGLLADRIGYGGLFSILLREPERTAARFYDALEMCKGPNLGCNFSLCCPFTLLAHYRELDFVQRCGVHRDLIRISVGIEDVRDLIEDLTAALGSASGSAAAPR